MTYLLDTNVISETSRSSPNSHVTAWFDAVPDELLFISVMSIGEIRKGIERLDDGLRKQHLLHWLEISIVEWFEDRILPVSIGVADRWGRLVAEADRSVPIIDSIIAATALHHDLRLVTRNAPDFQYPGLEVIDPWSWDR